MALFSSPVGAGRPEPPVSWRCCRCSWPRRPGPELSSPRGAGHCPTCWPPRLRVPMALQPTAGQPRAGLWLEGTISVWASVSSGQSGHPGGGGAGAVRGSGREDLAFSGLGHGLKQNAVTRRRLRGRLGEQKPPLAWWTCPGSLLRPQCPASARARLPLSARPTRASARPSQHGWLLLRPQACVALAFSKWPWSGTAGLAVSGTGGPARGGGLAPGTEGQSRLQTQLFSSRLRVLAPVPLEGLHGDRPLTVRASWGTWATAEKPGRQGLPGGPWRFCFADPCEDLGWGLLEARLVLPSGGWGPTPLTPGLAGGGRGFLILSGARVWG